MKNPQTFKEWQEAVNFATAAIALDAAQAYGLVTGGPAVDVVRCWEIVRLGHARGVHSAPDAIDNFLLDLAARSDTSSERARNQRLGAN